jgi:hypothetical protein
MWSARRTFLHITRRRIPAALANLFGSEMARELALRLRDWPDVLGLVLFCLLALFAGATKFYHGPATAQAAVASTRGACPETGGARLVQPVPQAAQARERHRCGGSGWHGRSAAHQRVKPVKT